MVLENRRQSITVGVVDCLNARQLRLEPVDNRRQPLEQHDGVTRCDQPPQQVSPQEPGPAGQKNSPRGHQAWFPGIRLTLVLPQLGNGPGS